MLEINNLILVNTLLSLLFIFGLLGIADSSSSFFIKRYKKINQIFFFNLICFFVIIVIGLASLIQIVYLFQIPKHKFFYSLFLFIVFFWNLFYF
jgi:heme A synthase